MTLLNAILQNDTVRVLVLDNQKSFVEYFKEPNTLIAFSAIVLSLVGIIATIITLSITIRHNKLSVVPILSISTHLVDKTNTINIEIINCGLGTATITEISLIYNDITYLRNDFKKLLEMNNIISNSNLRLYSFTDKSPISSNQRIPLFISDIAEDYNYYKINDIFSKTKISVDYLTLYNERKNHTDFLR